MFRRFYFHFAAWLAISFQTIESAEGDRVDLSRDIRPILSDRCFQCQGPDESSRQAGLQLDLSANGTSCGNHGQ